MVRIRVWVSVGQLFVGSILSLSAQQAPATAAKVMVPPLVNFSGVVSDGNGKPLSGTVGITFSLYKDSQSGAPLWVETQNVQADKSGHYSVALGSSSSQGLPPDLFVLGEARWLSVQPQGQAEQPRVLLLSVPYALKAADAETVGGLPPSAFMLAVPPSSGSSSGTSSGSNANSNSNPNLPPGRERHHGFSAPVDQQHDLGQLGRSSNAHSQGIHFEYPGGNRRPHQNQE